MLASIRQYKRGLDYIEILKNNYNHCQNWDSLQQVFKLLNIFDKKKFVENPPSVFITAINEQIPFFKVNAILMETLPRQNNEVASNIFFTLYTTFPQHRDSIWWGMCDHLFPGSSFTEIQLNEFLKVYKERKRTEMVEAVQYDLWSDKSHTQILDALKNNKISKTPGWQLIAEYGVYYYSESESRNTTETKKLALNLMQQASSYFKYDGELQKHIGHCLFLLGRSSEAQAYYKKAKQLGANMTDVGAYGGTATRTGPRGGKYQYKIKPGTVDSQE
jgi:tetratricopeptide (TPR) repeat protein